MPSEHLDRLPSTAGVWSQHDDDGGDPRRCEAVREVVATALTGRQREVVELFYFEGRSQGEIARALGVTQQVVQKCLHGVMRGGRPVGGALRRLREVFVARGLS